MTLQLTIAGHKVLINIDTTSEPERKFAESFLNNKPCCLYETANKFNFDGTHVRMKLFEAEDRFIEVFVPKEELIEQFAGMFKDII